MKTKTVKKKFEYPEDSFINKNGVEIDYDFDDKYFIFRYYWDGDTMVNIEIPEKEFFKLFPDTPLEELDGCDLMEMNEQWDTENDEDDIYDGKPYMSPEFESKEIKLYNYYIGDKCFFDMVYKGETENELKITIDKNDYVRYFYYSRPDFKLEDMLKYIELKKRS